VQGRLRSVEPRLRVARRAAQALFWAMWVRDAGRDDAGARKMWMNLKHWTLIQRWKEGRHVKGGLRV
jgi:hypothetical protein